MRPSRRAPRLNLRRMRANLLRHRRLPLNSSASFHGPSSIVTQLTAVRKTRSTPSRNGVASQPVDIIKSPFEDVASREDFVAVLQEEGGAFGNLTGTSAVAAPLNPAPSAAPSLTTSIFSGILQSLLPGVVPSHTPSASPSARPSTYPSLMRSTDPSTSPSLSPSTRPSTNPSLRPSTLPSTGYIIL